MPNPVYPALTSTTSTGQAADPYHAIKQENHTVGTATFPAIQVARSLHVGEGIFQGPNYQAVPLLTGAAHTAKSVPFADANGDYTQDNAALNYDTSTKQLTAGVLRTNVLPASGVATTIATGGTVAVGAAGVVRTINVGAATGIIMAVGTVDGQRVVVTNEGSGSLTMAAVATSHVANGVSCVIAVLSAAEFVWVANAVVPAWYSIGLT